MADSCSRGRSSQSSEPPSLARTPSPPLLLSAMEEGMDLVFSLVDDSPLMIVDLERSSGYGHLQLVSELWI